MKIATSYLSRGTKSSLSSSSKVFMRLLDSNMQKQAKILYD